MRGNPGTLQEEEKPFHATHRTAVMQPQAKAAGSDSVVALDDARALKELDPLSAVAETVGGQTGELRPVPKIIRPIAAKHSKKTQNDEPGNY